MIGICKICEYPFKKQGGSKYCSKECKWAGTVVRQLKRYKKAGRKTREQFWREKRLRALYDIPDHAELVINPGVKVPPKQPTIKMPDGGPSIDAGVPDIGTVEKNG